MNRVRKSNNIWAAVLLTVTLAACAGCGYTTRSGIASTYKSIYIPQFENRIDITRESDAASRYKTYKPLLEADITKALINRFLFDGNLRPVKAGTADVTLKGELVEFRREALRYSSGDIVEEYRLVLVVNISLLSNPEKNIIWEEKNFAGESTYFTSGVNTKSEGTAINDAVTDLCRRIVERTVEQW
ncbi:MAG: LPS assembly lipoprotein LptE [Candidatus Omnitrophota bacterium]